MVAASRRRPELLDGIEYFLFPNLMVWAGYLTPFVYRFRPEGNDPDRCIVDIMKLEPLPESGERPPRPEGAPSSESQTGEQNGDQPQRPGGGQGGHYCSRTIANSQGMFSTGLFFNLSHS